MTKQKTPPTLLLSPLRLSLIYALFGGLWVVFADDLVLLAVNDIEKVAELQTLQNTVFICLTAGLVFYLASKLLHDSEKARHKALADIAALEQRFEENTAELRASENYIREVLANSAEAIITFDEKGFIETYNPAAEGVFGYSADEAIGQSISLFVPENSRAVHDVYMSDTRQFAKTILNKPRDITTVRKNGEHFALRLNVSSMSVKGELKFVAIMRDITVRKALEEDLRMAKTMAEQANRSKSDFLSSMSHELRTPLNAIIGFSDSMLSGVFGKIENESHTEYLGHIKSSGEHLLGLINEVLDLSKIEAGKMDLRCEPTTPCEIINECTQLFEVQAQKQDISISVDPGQNSALHVSADPRRLRQVLMNLISNAIKYNTKGGRLNIVCNTPNPERLRITVTDTGTGLSQAELKELFVPFSRLHAEHSGVPGTGIGLTLSKRLIEEMDGMIGVESVKGEGSTFWIELPVLNEHAVA